MRNWIPCGLVWAACLGTASSSLPASRPTSTPWPVSAAVPTAPSTALPAPSPARAVLLVDASGAAGAFLTIQDAVDVAAPGDRILVAPGTYDGFQVRKPLTILGEVGVVVTGEVLVSKTPAQSVTVLAGFEGRQIVVLNCRGTVLLEDLDLEPLLAQDPHAIAPVCAELCGDVRIHGTSIQGPYPGGGGDDPDVTGLFAAATHLELVDCALVGTVQSCVMCGSYSKGVNMMTLDPGCSVQVAHSDLEGGTGVSMWGVGLYFDCGSFSASLGGLGMLARRSTVRFAQSAVRGGWNGANGSCGYFGRRSSIELREGTSVRSSHTNLTTAPTIFDGSVFVTPDSDPTLMRMGDVVPGATLDLDVRGEPGAVARLFFGDDPVVDPLPGTLGDRLTSEDSTVSLGAIPASGLVSYTHLVPANATPGDLLWVQAEVVHAPGDVRRTTSLPLLVR